MEVSEESDRNRKELEKQTGVSGSKGTVAIAMGQALLTKVCTKDLLERLKVLYELAGFPGKAIVEKSGWGTCTEHKSASCSIPRSRVGFLMEMCGCAQGCSIAPSTWQVLAL